jgi:hypothetical protein
MKSLVGNNRIAGREIAKSQDNLSCEDRRIVG